MIFVVFNYIIRNDTRVLILERVLIGKGGQTERERGDFSKQNVISKWKKALLLTLFLLPQQLLFLLKTKIVSIGADIFTFNVPPV